MLYRDMVRATTSLEDLSDRDLLTEVERLTERERCATGQLIAALAELDARRLYLGEGCSSLFTYCTQVLRLSEHAAYGRIEAARAARRFPVILELLTDGAITLTAVSLLRPHLTPENHREMLAAARHKSKRDIEHLVARLRPRPAVPPLVRKLPAPAAFASSPQSNSGPLLSPAVGPSAHAAAPQPSEVFPKSPATVSPLAPERYKVQLTVGPKTYATLRRVQDLMRHRIPPGDLAAIFDRALTALLTELERERLAATARPRNSRQSTPALRSRHVPAVVRRAVWARDGGRCAFVGARGRCTERGFLELHHVVPYAAGGETTVENIELRCRAHNAYEADLFFGTGQTVREMRPPFG
jgi:HNH endonuclease